MVNGRWLMRDRQITCLDENELLRQADDYARQIDAFLIQREKSVLSKLIAIGGTVEEESFEVQAKVRVPDPAAGAGSAPKTRHRDPAHAPLP